MTTQLYLVPLPESQATTPPQNATQSNVDVSGLLQQGGVSTENIATSNIDLSITGQFRAGPRFSEKLAKELKSLSGSSYSGVALFDADPSLTEPERGYYELESVDVNRVHKSTGDAQQYTANLTTTGTRETHWRAVRTREGSINTALSTGSGGLIGIPDDDLKERWFSTGNGTEVATPTSTVEAELGTVALFDPTDSTFDNPTLLFQQPYESEGPVDVRVWDDVGEPNDKYASFADGEGGTVEVPQWIHSFHGSFEFDGAPIVDNGLLRVRFDESAGVIEATEWNDGTSSWDSVAIDHGDYELFDVDVGHAGPGKFGPSRVDVFTEWVDTRDGSIEAAVLSFQRGIADVVVRQPPNGTVPQRLEAVLSPIASDQTTDQNPQQGVKARSEVK